jgi:hypothetical protein
MIKGAVCVREVIINFYTSRQTNGTYWSVKKYKESLNTDYFKEA